MVLDGYGAPVQMDQCSLAPVIDKNIEALQEVMHQGIAHEHQFFELCPELRKLLGLQ